jgi:hypothetical protein
MQSRLQPAVIGGVFIGVLSALPLISAGNCCCCLWIVGGGMIAAYLLQQHQPTPITIGDGAGVGAIAGLVGACVHLAISIPVQLVAGPIQMRMFQRIMERMAAENPDLGRMADQMQYGAAHGIFALVLGFIFFLFVGTAMATLGGMLGAMFFKKDQPPVAPPMGPMPPFNPPPLP